MKTKRHKATIARLKRAEKIGWRKLREQEKPIAMSPEQRLEWLDGVRAFMFEIWKQNPSLYKAYQKAKRLGF